MGEYDRRVRHVVRLRTNIPQGLDRNVVIRGFAAPEARSVSETLEELGYSSTEEQVKERFDRLVRETGAMLLVRLVDGDIAGLARMRIERLIEE